MTIDYHRVPMIQFRPDAELYAAIEAHHRLPIQDTRLIRGLLPGCGLRSIVANTRRISPRGYSIPVVQRERVCLEPEGKPCSIGEDRATASSSSPHPVSSYCFHWH